MLKHIKLIFVFLVFSSILVLISCYIFNGNVTVRGQLSIPQNNNIVSCCFISEETVGCSNDGTPYTWEDSVSTESKEVRNAVHLKIDGLLKESGSCFLETLFLRLKLIKNNVRLISISEGRFKIIMIKNRRKSTPNRSYIDIEYRGKEKNAITIVNTYMQSVIDTRFSRVVKAENTLTEQITMIKSKMDASEIALHKNNTERNSREVKSNTELYRALIQRLREVKIANGSTENDRIYISGKAQVIDSKKYSVFSKSF